MTRAPSAPGGRPPRRRAPLARRLGVGAVLAAAGLLFVTSAQTSRGTDLRTETVDLVSLVREESTRLAARGAQVSRLRASVEELARAASPQQAARAEEEAARLAPSVGTAPVEGPGLEVVLDDAPRDRPAPAGAGPNDLVVHQQDVQAVLNALWSAGAEAMTIMDQRVVSTSAPRCVGNVLILQGRTYSPPYRIAAVGDPAALRAALDASPQVSVYREYVAAYGLGYRVRALESLRAPAYDGPLRLEHVRALPGSAAPAAQGSAGEGAR